MTDATSVTYTVTYDQAVTGVDATDFRVARPMSVPGNPSITVQGNGAAYTVTVSGISVDGQLRLGQLDDDSIISAAEGLPLSGPGTSRGFASAVTFASGASASDLAFADVNGDFKPDLVIANPQQNALSVLLGNGDGTFRSALTSAASTTASSPRLLRLADVNGDNKIDVLTLDQAQTMRLLLGNGDGTFRPATIIGSGSGPIAVGRINGDAAPDLLFAQSNTSRTLLSMLGNGDGTFKIATTAITPISSTNTIGFALSADLNADGKTDLVYSPSSGAFAVALGNGDGTFSPPTNTAGTNPNNAALADVNGDGILDIVTVTLQTTNGSVGVALGNGNGTFKPRVTFTCTKSPDAVIVADVNGDGFPDLVTHHYNINGAINVLLGNGNGTFQRFTSIAAKSNATLGLAIGDANGDGQPDLAIVDVGVSVFLNNRFAFLSDDCEIDQTAPAAALTSKPASASNSTSATFTFTANDPSVFGVASGLSQVEYQLDGAAFVPAVSPLSLTGLGTGPHSFTLRATDNVGHITTAAHAWVVDTTAPTAAITTKPPSFSTSATATFEFSGADPLVNSSASGINRLEIRLDGAPFATAQGTKTYTGLSESLHTFDVRAVDNAGNYSPFVSYTWTVQAKAAPILKYSEFIDPHPAPGNRFGETVVPLSTGNVVVTAPGDDAGGVDAGAVYLFNGATGALVSTLIGSHAGDQIGSHSGNITVNPPVLALNSGNYVIVSPSWDNDSIVDAGAVTFGNGNTGVSGTISAANSLVGSTAGDMLGKGGVADPPFVISDGRVAMIGAGVAPLANGNYVVIAPQWDNGAAIDAGAVAFGSGATGIVGTLSSANSLVGTSANDTIGSSVGRLPNGSYVVCSSSWDNGAATDAGAVTFGNGTTGISGPVGDANSLVGSQTGDQVGREGIVALANGNYIVASSRWSNGAATSAGAATFGSGVSGVSGVVSAANSLVGTKANDFVGIDGAGNNGATPLSNGNYVVTSSNWANGTLTKAGAITLCNGSTGLSGTISAANSLVGTHKDDRVGPVVALKNGNYVVASGAWNSFQGAVTLGNGTTGIVGSISAANSLIGTGTPTITVLSNGNYVVNSVAITFGNGLTGVTGNISAANSLMTAGATVTALSNGNYVVRSPFYDNGNVTDVGAVTFCNGATGTVGFISAANSLIGTTANDRVGSGSLLELKNGNYVVASPQWTNGTAVAAGAVTMGDAAIGIAGPVSATNSLVGTATNDNIGSAGGSSASLFALSHGNYVVRSPNWTNGAATAAGAVTFGNQDIAITGPVSSANSLVGTTANDHVASYIYTLSNGSYVATSNAWDNGTTVDIGAVTFGSGAVGISGSVNVGNSLVGAVVDYSINVLSNGNYLVPNLTWDNGPLIDAGAMSFGNGVTGTAGVVSADNSALGTSANAGLSATVAPDNVNNTFYVSFPNDGNGRVVVGSQVDGFKYTTATTLTTTPQATTGGQLVTFTATIGPNPRNLGAVTFHDGAAVLAANVPLVGGVAAFQTATLSQGTHSLRADYSGGGGFSASSSDLTSFVVSAPLAPHVVNVTVNGATQGLAGPQRARVANLVVTFDERVQLDASALMLSLHTNDVTFGGVPQPSGLGVLPTSLNLATMDDITWTVTFTGNTETGADGYQSLQDGVYDLNIDASKVHPFGVPNIAMAANSTTAFHRLLGDSDAPTTPAGGTVDVDFSAVVNTGDNFGFRGAFNRPANYLPYFDFDGDGVINTGDNFQVRNRFNKALTWRV